MSPLAGFGFIRITGSTLSAILLFAAWAISLAFGWDWDGEPSDHTSECDAERRRFICSGDGVLHDGSDR